MLSETRNNGKSAGKEQKTLVGKSQRASSMKAFINKKAMNGFLTRLKYK